jgi:hypothetical protein
MDMHGIDKEAVIATIDDSGCVIVDIQEDYSAGVQWESFRYCATKMEVAGHRGDDCVLPHGQTRAEPSWHSDACQQEKPS